MPGSGKTLLLHSVCAASEQPVFTLNMKAQHPDAAWQIYHSVLQHELRIINLAETLAAITEPTLLAIDDLHCFLDSQHTPLPFVQAWLDAALSNPMLTIVCTTLAQPELPRHTWLFTDGLLRIVEAAQLRFSMIECMQLWEAYQGTQLDVPQAQELLEYTGGWAACVALCCQSDWPPAPAEIASLVAATCAQLTTVEPSTLALAAVAPKLDAATTACITGVRDGLQVFNSWCRLGLISEHAGQFLPVLRLYFREQIMQAGLVEEQRIAQLCWWYAQQSRTREACQLAHFLEQWSLLARVLEEYGADLCYPAAYPELIDLIHSLPASLCSPPLSGLLLRGLLATEDFAQAAELLAGLRHPSSDPAALQQAMRLLQELRLPSSMLEQLGVLDLMPPIVQQDHVGERCVAEASGAWSAAQPRSAADELILRARLALKAQQLELAQRLAIQAYVCTQSQTVDEHAAIAAAWLLGDTALCQQEWAIAAARYRKAAQMAAQHSQWSEQSQLLALEALAAWHGAVYDWSELLTLVDLAALKLSAQDVWLGIARALVCWRLGLFDFSTSAKLLMPLASAADPAAGATGALLLAVIALHIGEVQSAAAAWERFVACYSMMQPPDWLIALLAEQRSLLEVAATQWHSAFAARLLGRPVLEPLGRPASNQIQLLGRPCILIGGQEMKLPEKGFLLLTLLVLAGERGRDRYELIEKIWSLDDEGKSDAFRKLLQKVRSVLPPQSIVLRTRCYRLDLKRLGMGIDLDFVLQTAVTSSDLERVRQAAALARGELLPGFDDYPWVLGERDAVARRGAELWVRLGDHALEQGALDDAADAYACAIAVQPVFEPAVIKAMQLALRQGRRSEAYLIGSRYCAAAVVEPSSEIEQLLRQSLQG